MKAMKNKIVFLSLLISVIMFASCGENTMQINLLNPSPKENHVVIKNQKGDVVFETTIEPKSFEYGNIPFEKLKFESAGKSFEYDFTKYDFNKDLDQVLIDVSTDYSILPINVTMFFEGPDSITKEQYQRFFLREDEVVRNRDKYKSFSPIKYSYDTRFVYPYNSLPKDVDEEKVFMLIPIPQDTMVAGTDSIESFVENYVDKYWGE